MTTYPEVHDLARLFPPMRQQDEEELGASIRQHGLQQPIVLWRGQVIDGRHRLAICQNLGIEPAYVEYEGDNPLQHVLDMNLARRHLTGPQKADLAVKLTDLDRFGRPKKSVSGDTLSQSEAAEAMGVSRVTVNRMAAVKRNGTDELQNAVLNGDVGMEEAAAIAKQPPAEQHQALVRRREPATQEDVDAKAWNQFAALWERASDAVKIQIKEFVEDY